MTDIDGSDSICYGLNGEKLVYNIGRFHDAKINASCLKITIKHPGRKKALIRIVAVVTAIFVALYFLYELLSVIIIAIVASLSLIVLWYAVVAGSKGFVLAVPGVGIQISTTYACGYTSSQFYPWRIVTNVIINETFTMYRVVFYLAILLGDGSSSDNSSMHQPIRIIPIFTEFNPRLPLIRQMYYDMKELLC